MEGQLTYCATVTLDPVIGWTKTWSCNKSLMRSIFFFVGNTKPIGNGKKDGPCGFFCQKVRWNITVRAKYSIADTT